MTLSTQRINNLVQGVSQAPPALRLSSQAEAQENFLSDVSSGLRTRPPLEHVAKLNSGSPGNRFYHTIDRDTNERYVLQIENGALKVYDLNGVEKTVALASGTPNYNYLNASDPKTAFRVVTVGDNTFIVNTEIATAMSGSPSASQIPTAIVSVKLGDYSTIYEVSVDGTRYKHQSAGSADTAARPKVATSYISSSLMKVIKDALGGTFTFTKNGVFTDPPDHTLDTGNAFKIVRQNSADFTISGVDGLGDTSLVVVKESVRRFTDLPKVGFDGFTCKVTGDDSNGYDDHWVKYDGTKGHWVEAVKPGLDNSFDASKMPHRLVRLSDGTFEFGRCPWASRTVGDEKSAPNPSFIGKKIAGVFFFANRLGFVSGENVIMSELGEYFNFFPTTVTALLDTGPIDIAAAGAKIAWIKHAVPHNKQLLLFSDTAQMLLHAQNDVISPRTVEMPILSEYDSLVAVQPVVSGDFVYFATNLGAYAGLVEYLTSGGQDSEASATPVSDHVPHYIDSGVFLAAASSTEKTVVLASRTNTNLLYVYRYYFSGNEKVQSSWSKFSIESGAEIKHAFWLDARLYLVIQRSDGLFLEKMNLREGSNLEGLGYDVRLDRKVQLTGVYSGGTGLTTWTLPYQDSGNTVVALKAGAWGSTAGALLNISRPSSTTATAVGDYSANPVVFGRPFISRYEFSEIFHRTTSVAGGEAAAIEGRYQLRRMSLHYETAGAFVARVTSKGREASVYKFSGVLLGSWVLGELPPPTGKFDFAILSNSRNTKVELEVTAHAPVAFQAASVEGKYWKRGMSATRLT